jgi:TetR/AcrR family transcriptional regulator, regulator of autoinduction and epiphytic fitness
MQSSETATARVGRPSKAAQDAASERIMAVAMELFAGRGFAGTSMEQVASHCGMGKDTLYRRFPSKVALFEAVVEHAHLRAVEQLGKLQMAEGDSLQRLKALLREMLHINMDADLIALKRITFSEAVVFEKDAHTPQQPDPIMHRLIDAVAEAQTTGSIRAGEAAAIASHLIHCLVALPTSVAMLGGDDYDTAAAVDAHFDITWLWLIEGLTAPAK